ncbi:MAG TPA: hypothetical protein VLD38_08085 [Nitrosopumilaceae archaeon]|nr:hypothetical protein [Nitrosopumilaceae archaeon]
MTIIRYQEKKNLATRSFNAVIMIIALVVGVMISPSLSASATSYDSFQSTQVTKVGSTSINVSAVKGKMTIYDPQISQSSDHRDTMVYLFHPFQFTLGAGYHVTKPSGSLVKTHLVYYYKDSAGILSHNLVTMAAAYPCIWGVVQQASPGSTNWKATIRDCNQVDIFTYTFTPGVGVTNPTPAAMSRALSQSVTGNNLPATIDQLTIGYWNGGSLSQHLIDSGVTVSDYKCASEDSWLYNLVSNYYKFTTGPGVASSDNCSSDNSVRKAPGE